MSQKHILEKIEMSRANLNLIYKRGHIDTKWLEKISEVLDVPMTYWFEDDNKSENIIIGNNLVNGNFNNIQSNLINYKNELDQALKKIKSLEEIIELKTMMINDLKEMLINSKK